jgi:putative transposase
MMRRINRQNIFEDDEDNEKFIEKLSKYRNIRRYDIYAFCLMGNHLHILIRENEEDLGKISPLVRG